MVTNDNQHIIRAKGINNRDNLLNYDTFVELFKGINITLPQIQFSKDFQDMSVGIKTIQKCIRGIKDTDIIYKINKKFGSVEIVPRIAHPVCL